MNDETGIVQCVCCKEDIKAGALKCTNCDTFQDWRRYFSFSNITLSLFIALLANVTTLYTTINSHAPKSVEIQAKDVKMDPNYLQVAVANTGNTVAILRHGTLKVKRNGQTEPPALELRPYSADGKPVDPSVEANRAKLLELQPFLIGGEKQLPRKLSSDSTCTYLVELEFVGIQQKPQKYVFETDECLGVSHGI